MNKLDKTDKLLIILLGVIIAINIAQYGVFGGIIATFLFLIFMFIALVILDRLGI